MRQSTHHRLYPSLFRQISSLSLKYLRLKQLVAYLMHQTVTGPLRASLMFQLKISGYFKVFALTLRSQN
jgi:hypothetical protein